MKSTISVREVASALSLKYKDFAHGNKSDPLEEILFILCSVKTAEKGYQRTYKALKWAFPTRSALARASVDAIAEAIRGGGLSNNKARSIRIILNRAMDQFGSLTMAPLRRWPTAECEAFLTSLPGVGKKVARCVMMYSLGREVFPVDTHCWRIGRGLGWVRPTTKDGRPSPLDMDRLQAKIPLHLRFSLHVNMVSLGRELCTSGKPRCSECPIAHLCPRIGVSPKH